MDLRLSESKIRLRLTQEEYKKLLDLQQVQQMVLTPMGMVPLSLTLGLGHSVQSRFDPHYWEFSLQYLNPSEGVTFPYNLNGVSGTVIVEVDRWSKDVRSKKENKS